MPALLGQNIYNFSSIPDEAQDENFKIPSTHNFQYIVSEGEFGTLGNYDFTAFVPNEGSSNNGHLSLNHELSSGGITVFDIAQSPSLKEWTVANAKAVEYGLLNRPCSGAVTSWGSVLAGEESAFGEVIEVDPISGEAIYRYQLGRLAHENVVENISNNRTFYTGEDTNNGVVLKFVADTPGDVSSGSLYALSVDIEAGTGNWVSIPNAPDTDTHAEAVGLEATTFNGVEDIEISPIDGKVYFAVKNIGTIYRFTENDPLGGGTISDFEVYVSNTDYDIGNENAQFGNGVDNLAFDNQGNLWALQDGGQNQIWVIYEGHTEAAPQVSLFGQVPTGAEPTGITFTPDYNYLFMSIQEPDDNNSAAQVDVFGNTVPNNQSFAVAIARNEQWLENNILLVDLDQFNASCTIEAITNGIEVSGAAYDPNSERILALSNGNIPADRYLNILQLNGSINPTDGGTIDLEGFGDPEAITHMSGDIFVIADESNNSVYRVFIDGSTQVVSILNGGVDEVNISNVDFGTNQGIEGLAYSEFDDRLYFVEEGNETNNGLNPPQLYYIEDFSETSFSAPAITVNLNQEDFFCGGANLDFSGMSILPDGTLLVTSDVCAQLYALEVTGTIVTSVTNLELDLTQTEAVTVVSDTEVWVAGEDDELQLLYIPGITMCNDGNPITEIDTYDEECICGEGIIMDIDDDGIVDAEDNCPEIFNPEQEDNDEDDIGDVCDADDDNDGVPDDMDNCPFTFNIDQEDIDFDNIGDACDDDDDGDGILDVVDNCPSQSNTDQANNDQDALGDICDPDDDNDGVPDDMDNCPLVFNPDQENNDQDSEGDICDDDDDNDGIPDIVDNCPFTANLDQADNDLDFVGDVCDPDDDNDGVLDEVDNCPFEFNPGQEDFNENNIGDACDDISCDDGIQNGDEEGIDCGGDFCPPCETCNDGILNNGEEFVDCGGDFCAPCPCVNAAQVDIENVCPLIFDPVCGCDGVTYGNDCEAEFFGGVTSWTQGACPTCEDGVQNGDEVGIDCGGALCSPCEACNDGILNNGEEFVDCGGDFCDPCPCVNDPQVDTEIICPAVVEPVCGCNQVTYVNECEAVNYGGVTSWTEGPCDTCNDGMLNNGEEFVDCGGDFCDPCPCVNDPQVDTEIICPAVVEPVCGCNQVTYVNECEAVNYGGVTSWTEGPCETCNDGILNNGEEFVDCGGDFCDPCPCVNEAQVDTENVCPLIFDPVCGCDGVTYGNDCEAEFIGGVTSWTQGACPTCEDGIQNGDEVGIDCGGALCSPCEACNDGILNNGEEFVDCGGDFCDPCPCVNDPQVDTEIICPAVVEPVCGCNQVTYVNECEAVNYGGVTSWTEGPCETCNDGILNNGEEFVDCGGDFCTPCPCVNAAQVDPENVCPLIFDPVCGCDGVTYGNDCEAEFIGGVTSWTQGACPTCEDGIQNGDEEGIDCGGSECLPCEETPCSEFYFTDFEVGFGDFNDGGSDCRRSINDAAFANSGDYCIRLRDNTSTSNTFSEIYDFTVFDGIQVSFTYIADKMEPGEDFWLQFSTDAGDTYTTVADYDSGDEFLNGIREFESVYIPGPFSANCRIRFALDASNNGDFVYLDDVLIETCSEGTCSDGIQNNGETFVDCGGPNCDPCPCVNEAQKDDAAICNAVIEPVCGCDGLTYTNACEAINFGGVTSWIPGACVTIPCTDFYANNFEVGFGEFNDGGSDCRRSITDAAFANSGEYCVRLRDNSSTSNVTSNPFDFSSYEGVTVSFNFIGDNMEFGEDLWLQISTDGGDSYTTVADYDSGEEFINGIREFESVFIEGPFSTNTIIRFTLDASNNGDYVYIDDVFIETCGEPVVATCDDGILNNGETFVDCGGPNCDPCPCVNEAQIDDDAVCVDEFAPVCGCDGITYLNECEAIVYGGVTEWTVGECDMTPCVEFVFTDFESGFGEFNDGGSDCRISINDAGFANSGDFCVRLRDNSSTSNTFSELYDFSSFESILVTFTYIADNMEFGEDLWLQISQDGGASYTTIAEYTSGEEFVNGTREFESQTIEGPFTANCIIRFELNASNNGDFVYLDDVLIETCSENAGGTCNDGILNNGEIEIDCGGPNCDPCESSDCNEFEYNDLEDGLGGWIDGGSDCRSDIDDTAFANSGDYCVRLRDNSSTSVFTSPLYTIPTSTFTALSFSYISDNMEFGESFLFEISLDDGDSWSTLLTYVNGTNFINGQRKFEIVALPTTAGDEVRFRFRCDASNNGDFVYIDDIQLEACEIDISGFKDDSAHASKMADKYTEKLSTLRDQESINGLANFKLYPNPISSMGLLQLEFEEEQAIVTTQIYGLEGNLITERDWTNNNRVIKFPVFDLSPGTYLLKVSTDTYIAVKRFVVIR